MKLSEQLTKDFSELEAFPNRDYTMSQDYLKQLIRDVQALEEQAANWDLLEQLPLDCGIHHDSYAASGDSGSWSCGESFPYESGLDGPSYCDTPAEALRIYWEGKSKVDCPETKLTHDKP